MKRAGMVAGFLAVCTPMLLSLLLLLAVSWPKMDAVTRHMGQGVQSMVARAILGFHPGDHSAQQRAESLAPGVLKRFREGYRPSLSTRPRTPRDEQYLTDLYAKQRRDVAQARALSDQADAAMKSGRGCDAEELYTKAGDLDQRMEIYRHTEGVGRAGLLCGDLPAARAGLEAAILKETNFLKGTEEDQLMDVRQARAADRQYLVVVYARQHDAVRQREACREVDARWKTCGCDVKENGVICHGAA